MENIKSKIIPESLKRNIDETLTKQLFNANRYYAETNPNISHLMNKELMDSPTEFLNKLIERWDWHNLYYELLLEPAYSNLVREQNIEMSPTEIDDIINVYFTSCLVDEATLVMSGAIKKYLDYKCSKISVYDERLPLSEAKNMLITPPVETFFAHYQIDHLYYIYLLKKDTNKAVEFKHFLKEKYHANDEVIFQSRFNKKFSDNLNMTEKELLTDIKKYTISKLYKINHFYFTLEHSDRKAIRDIIIYDNLTEKLIASNLIGISGFLLRRKVLEYLNGSNILPNAGYIYEFSNDVVIQSLEKLKFERKKIMDKNIHLYKQRGDTCAIACLMMAMEYYGLMQKANWYDEKRYYKIYGSRFIDGTPFSALAYHFSKNGLNTSIYHSEEELFSNKIGEMDTLDFENTMKEYKEYLVRAKEKGTNIVNGIEINHKLLREKLEEGNIVILAGKISNVYHAVLLSGYENDKFIVCDPLYKTKQIKSSDEIEKFMNTDIGKWFITVNNFTKEKEKLIDNLERFNDDAKRMMKDENVKKMSYERK